MMVKLTLADHIEPGSYEAHRVAAETLHLVADLPHDPTVLGRTGKAIWRDRDEGEEPRLLLVGPNDPGRAEATYHLSTITL